MMSENGILACTLAFQRLKNGTPNVKAHVGIERSKITAGVVSVEAGFDRGYLKKSRPKHLPLLAQINSYSTSKAASKETINIKYHRAQAKIKRLEEEVKQCSDLMYKVLTQNLQLVETVRRLEEIAKIKSAQ